MHFILYAMLSLNVLMGYMAYTIGDSGGIRHAVLFATVAVCGLVLAGMSRREPK